MSKYLLSEAVVGTAADLPDASDPLAGASSVPTALYIESDTGVIRLSTGAGWVVVGQMTVGTLPPGVTSDGQTLGGLVVAGNAAVAGAQSGGPAMLGVGPDTNGPYNAQFYVGKDGELFVHILDNDFASEGFLLVREKGSSGSYGAPLAHLTDWSGEDQLLLLLQARNPVNSTLIGSIGVGKEGGLGLFSKTPPTAPRTLAQATITAITDANTKTAVQAVANALADMGALTIT